MTTEPPNQDLKAIWRDQPTENMNMSVVELHLKAQRFQLKSRLVLTINYVTTTLIAVLFGWGVATAPNWLTKLGCVTGLLFCLAFGWWAHQRRPGRMPAAQSPGTTILEFHRRELERARVRFRTMLIFLVPVLLSSGLITAGAYAMRPSTSLLHRPALIALLIVAWVVVAWRRQRQYAQKIQRQIDEWDAVRLE